MIGIVPAAWKAVSSTPLLWLTTTLLAYVVAREGQRVLGDSPLLNPVLIATALVIALLLATGTPYDTYAAGSRFISFLLGPATVALAVPLARNLRHLRTSLLAAGPALLAGSLTAMGSGIGLARGLGGSQVLALSMMPKSVTTPVAMAVSEQIGGLPSLSAALAISSGIVAATVGPQLLRLLRVSDPQAQGLAAGVAGGGIAAAQVAALDELAAAFAASGLALNALLTACVAPAITSLCFG